MYEQRMKGQKRRLRPMPVRKQHVGWLAAFVMMAAIIGGGLFAMAGSNDARASHDSDLAPHIHIDNLIEGGYSGTTLCSESEYFEDGETDEWHWVITSVSGAKPSSIFAIFANAGLVEVQLGGGGGASLAHYYHYDDLDDTLLDSYFFPVGDSTYGRFNLSHAPCGDEPDDPQATIEVRKTADASFTRTHEWDIDKSVTTENEYTLEGDAKIWLYTDGSGDEEATWTVDVTYEGYTDSDFTVSGTIEVENTSETDTSHTINSIVDDLGVTGFEDIDLVCTLNDAAVLFPAELPAGETIICTYSVTDDLLAGTSGENTVSVSVDDIVEPFTAFADWEFGDPTKETNASVNIEDFSDLFGTVALGSVTAPNDAQFPYSKTFAFADYEACGSYHYDNTATIVETEQSASAKLRVNVQCYNYETAYGDGGGENACFIPDFSRWGWSNLISAGETTLDLYAGAAQCDHDKGTFVGTVTVTYDGVDVTVVFNILPGFDLEETHVYAGESKYPTDRRGRTTVAPGQYTNNGPFSGDPVYVIAHAVVGVPDPNFGP